jgi:hypothetical protein
MAKTAFMVLGAESSGTRFLTRCMIASGCDGDGNHRQRFDKTLEGAGDKIVWRRSLPHKTGDQREWPDLDSMLKKLREFGYEARVLAVIRNHYCTCLSQVQHGHSATVAEATLNAVGAIRRISSFVLENNLPVMFFTYESLVHNFEIAKNALKDWGIDFSKPAGGILDANVKYLSTTPAARMAERIAGHEIGWLLSIDNHIEPNPQLVKAAGDRSGSRLADGPHALASGGGINA